MTEEFDLIIIGSGSGNSIPEYLSDRKIALIEQDRQFGGTCLNRGCIPSKMFVLPADVLTEARDSAKLGLDISVHGADWSAIRDRVFGRIDPISAGGKAYRESGTPNLTLVEGTARFSGPHSVVVGERELGAPQILVAAGARPSIPPIAGLSEAGYLTSDTIMRLDHLPDRLGIIGAGFIAVEMAHVFSAYGSAVTMFARGDSLMRHADPDLSHRFTDVFAERVDLRTNVVPTEVQRIDGAGKDGGPVWRIITGDRVEAAGGDASGFVEVDQLLVATGRQANCDLLDLPAAGIQTTDQNVIAVDEHMATTVDGVWAIGDIANTWQLKHVANAEAKVAFWNIAHPDELRSIDYSAVPAAVFSNPQLASVGLTEPEAQATGRSIAIGVRDYASTAYGWALDDHTSFAKVIIDSATKEILGAHLMGPQAATLIQPLIQAMQFGQSADEIALGQYWIHPALTEVVENALLAALEQP